MFDPLDEDKKKENMTLDDSLSILANIQLYLITYENDTNEVKGSYHDDCLEKKEKKNIFCILNWGMRVSCSRNMNFVKCRVSETSEEKFSMFDIYIYIFFFFFFFFAFFAHFCIGAFFADQVELTKHPPPPIFLFFM